MNHTPFHELLRAKMSIRRMNLRESLYNIYEQHKPTLRFHSAEVQFDDVEYVSDSSDDGTQLGQIDPDHFNQFIAALKRLNVSPYTVLSDLGLRLPNAFTRAELWSFLDELEFELRKCRYQRVRQPQISSFEHALRCFKFCRNIVFLVGAGISVASGIPDFRSANGIYANLGKYELSSPTDMFSIDFFRQNKLPFYKFVPEVMPQDKYRPTFTHLFIYNCWKRGKLRRIYTQNIDCLERRAGIPDKMILSCHGSFATASCMACRRKVAYEQIKERLAAFEIPMCEFCSPQLSKVAITPQTRPADVPECVLKPDIVFFGEKLKDMLGDYIELDSHSADMLVIVGSSLKVKPIAGLVGALPRQIPQVLINKERITGTHEFDVELLGDCDVIFSRIAKALGWLPDMAASYQDDPSLKHEASVVAEASEADVLLQKVVGHEWMYKAEIRK